MKILIVAFLVIIMPESGSCTFSTGFWSPWSIWSMCNNSYGLINRTRNCIVLNTNFNMSYTKSDSCFGTKCEVMENSAYWAQWSNWSDCNDYYGIMNRTRECIVSNVIDWCYTNNSEAETLQPKGNLLTTVQKLSKEYSLSFEINPTCNQISLIQNIFHLSDDIFTLGYGEHNSSIWFDPSGFCMLYICFNVNNQDNCMSTISVKPGTWSSIKVSQELLNAKYIHSVQINGDNISQVENKDAQEFFNSNVYVFDPFFEVQRGYMRYLKITNRNSEEETLQLKGNLLTSVKRISKEYFLSFEFNLTCIQSSLIQNIFHLSDDIFTLGCGEQNSSVWFDPFGFCILYICFKVSNKDNCMSTISVKPGTWSSIKVSQELLNAKYIHSVQINGDNVSQVENNDAQEFFNSNVYVFNPFFEEQHGYIRGLKITNKYPEAETLQSKGVLLTTMQKLNKEYSISFEINPTCFQSTLIQNIFHLSDDIITLGYGEQNSSMWLNSRGFCMLYVCFNVNNKDNCMSTISVIPGTWSLIKISQELLNGMYIHSVQINGDNVSQVENKDAQEFFNSNVYVFDPFYEVQYGYIRNLKITNRNPAILEKCISQYNCNNTYGSISTTRPCNFSNTLYQCNGKNIELKKCYDCHIDSSVFGFIEGNVLNISLKISGSGYNVTLEYFFPIFVAYVTERVPPGFLKVNSNQNKYIFSGYFESKVVVIHNITSLINKQNFCGGFLIEIPIKISYQNETSIFKFITLTFRKSLPCVKDIPTGIPKDKNALKEYYGRGIVFKPGKTYLYICMNQHVGSTNAACYYSNNTGGFMKSLDLRVGCVLGHHPVTKELYAIHRNQKLYLYFDVAYKKWLGLTHQQFQKLATNLDSSLVVNLEENHDQVYTFERDQWMGNADGLFYRNQLSSSWIQRVKWN